MTSRSMLALVRLSSTMVIIAANRLLLSSSVPRPYTYPPLRVALNGGNVHFDGSTFTVSLWPMMSSGFFDPFPLIRAITFGCAGSCATIDTAIPSASSVFFTKAATPTSVVVESICTSD